MLKAFLTSFLFVLQAFLFILVYGNIGFAYFCLTLLETLFCALFIWDVSVFSLLNRIYYI